jgi:hypothetical protein
VLTWLLRAAGHRPQGEMAAAARINPSVLSRYETGHLLPKTQTRRALYLLLATLTIGYVLQGQASPDLSTAELQGGWKQIDGADLLNVKGDQLFALTNGTLRVLGIIHRRADIVVLRNAGIPETWRASLKSGVLELGHGKEIKRYLRLATIPAAVELHPVIPGEIKPLHKGKRSPNRPVGRPERERSVAGSAGQPLPRRRNPWALRAAQGCQGRRSRRRETLTALYRPAVLSRSTGGAKRDGWREGGVGCLILVSDHCVGPLSAPEELSRSASVGRGSVVDCPTAQASRWGSYSSESRGFSADLDLL